jgi:hypothetical protein
MRSRWFCLIFAFAVPDAAAGQSVSLLDTAPLQAARLRESSGVAPSSRPGVYWTHNDSGDGPYLYTTDSSGRDLGRVTVGGARAIDWESIDTGPCVTAPGHCLYIGDIGDNRSRRRSVTIYRVVEPVPPTSPGDTLRTVQVLDSLVVRYPGGPRDAETLIVTPDSMLLLVSKPRSGRPHLYRLDLRRPPARMVTDAGPLAIDVSLPRGRLVTDGTMSPDGRFVVLRTYVSLHFFRYAGGGSLAPVAGPAGIPIPFIEAQGEGVAFDGPDRLVLTSEAGAAERPTIARLRVVLPER